MTGALSFRAEQVDGREQVKLVRADRARGLFSKSVETLVDFDDWPVVAPASSRPAVARLLQAWADNETADGAPFVEPADRGVRLHPQFVAQLSDAEATALGLPPAARLSLNLQSKGVPQQPSFAVASRWTRPNGLPAQVHLAGSRIRYDGKDWRIPEPIWSTLASVELVNQAAEQDQRQAALAKLRTAIGDEDRVHVRPDGFIERLRLTYAAGFSLDLKPSAAGFDFDPVLFSPERLREAEEGAGLDEAADGLLPPLQQATFANRFRQGDGTRRAYLLDDGAILFLDPQLRKALRVVRQAQSAGPEARRKFASSPQRHISEALQQEGADTEVAATLFIETQQFSERVSGIDLWRKPVLPWIKPKPNSWLPEAFGLRIGGPPDDKMVEIAVERVGEALAAAESALREARPTFTFDSDEIPATEQTRSALRDLASLAEGCADADAEQEVPPAVSQHRYFLQVRDNLEDVAYAPLQGPEEDTEATPAAALPEELISTPKPHQVEGFEWLTRCWRRGVPGALLADDMGLGKTFQALAFLAWLRHDQSSRKPVLIVAPTGLLANWRAEIERHLRADALGPVVRAYGSDLKRMRGEPGRDIESGSAGIGPEAWEHAGIVLTTFETMRDYHLSFARQPFAAIIYDEAQKLKNPASQMTRAAKTLNGRFQLAMTGTPVENRLQDLWSLYDVIHPGLLGSSRAFESDYPTSDLEKLRSLHDLLAKPDGKRPPLLLRRMKDECLPGLPAKHIRPLPTPMPPSQASAYEKVIQRALAARATGKRGHMLEILHQLRGVSLHPTAPEAASDDYLVSSARLQAAFSTLDAIERAGEKALLFCESLAMQALLAVEIRRRYRLDHDIARIHGGVTGEARQAAVDLFQRRAAGFDVMILSPKAGGVGITLTAANHVIHLSRWWNPAVEDQATDRAYRIGQTKDVFVYLPQAVHPDAAIGPASFDLKLNELMERKRELSRGLLMPGEDESDIDDLLDSVLSAKAEPENIEKSEPSSKEDDEVVKAHGASHAAPQLRPTLVVPASARKAEPAASFPRRVAFAARTARNMSIFHDPVRGERIVQLTVRDPYGCADDRNRQAIVDLAAELAKSAASIAEALIVSFDAESADRNYRETSGHQREDLENRWHRVFPRGPQIRHVQLSRRQVRSFHDRSIQARTASGRTIIWDLSNGVDGVMLPHKECTVHLTVETAQAA